MKLLIVSDIHGSSYYARKIKEIDEREQPDQIILLGDLYYHGPRNDLTQEYNPMEVASILNNLKHKILACKGNCDAEVDQMITEFPLQKHIELNIDGLEMLFTHGHRYNRECPPIKPVNVLIYGHFHTGFIEEKDGIVFANAGSISLPRNQTPHSYLIYENQKLILKDIEGSILVTKEW